MLAHRIFIMSCIATMTLLGLVACAPDIGDGAQVGVPPPATETAPEVTQSSGGGLMVDVTPMSASELATQPMGQSEPGAEEGPRVEPKAEEEQRQPGKMALYTDSSYGFSVRYPDDFVFRTETAEKLAQFTPRPVASFILINPVTAASDLGDLEPGDLEIRVYAAGETSSLADWLTASRWLAHSAAPLQPFQTDHVAGVQVCASTMIAPGCSYFVLGKGWVYQLTPATLEGEAIVESVMLLP